MSVSVAVAGASGYAGGELLRLIAAHPEFEVRTVTAHDNAGQRLHRIHPQLSALPDLELQPTDASTLAGHDVVFLALPHGASGALAAEFGDDVLVVDCGADHRLADPADWAAFYDGEHHGSWPYGMPELLTASMPDGGTPAKQRTALTGVRRIAVPGCNVTAVTLGIAPALTAGLVHADDLVAVLAVGTSGAGRSPKTHLLASEIMGSASPYAVGGTHRHIPEILQNLAPGAGQRPTLSFTPVLVPMSRGILATTTAKLAPGVTGQSVRAAYEQAYDDEAFIQVLPDGAMPKTADVIGANTLQIGLAIDRAAGRLVAVSAVDNLTKGTAGAAIQSANVALGLPEGTGLPLVGVAP